MRNWTYEFIKVFITGLKVVITILKVTITSFRYWIRKNESKLYVVVVQCFRLKKPYRTWLRSKYNGMIFPCGMNTQVKNILPLLNYFNCSMSILLWHIIRTWRNVLFCHVFFWHGLFSYNYYHDMFENTIITCQHTQTRGVGTVTILSTTTRNVIATGRHVDIRMKEFTWKVVNQSEIIPPHKPWQLHQDISWYMTGQGLLATITIYPISMYPAGVNPVWSTVNPAEVTTPCHVAT